MVMPIGQLGVVSIESYRLTNIGIPMLKIRRYNDRLTFNMGIALPRKTVFILRRGSNASVAFMMDILMELQSQNHTTRNM